MYPVLTLGPIEISSYVLLLSLGASLSLWLTYREATRAGDDAGAMVQLAAIAFLAGLVGARILSFLTNRRLYAEQPWWSVFAIWDRGGMALYGGLVLSAAVGLVYIRRSGMGEWEASDRLVVAWLPFLVFMRIGCFLNGCCYGKPTTSPLGLVAGGSPNAVNFDIPSHPASLYDAAALLALFGLLWWMRKRRRFAGQLTLTFLVLHSGFRFFHEMLRGDPRLAWRLDPLGLVSFNQFASLALLALGLAGYAFLGRRERPQAPTAD